MFKLIIIIHFVRIFLYLTEYHYNICEKLMHFFGRFLIITYFCPPKWTNCVLINQTLYLKQNAYT